MDLLILLSLFVPAVIGQFNHEVVVTYHSYANPSGRCIDCGGGPNPGCCDVSTPVPQDQSCQPEICDTALSYCFRSFGSTSACSQNENEGSLAPRVQLDSSSAVFNDGFFGLPNPVRYRSGDPWQGQLQILHTFHECTQSQICIVDFDTVIDSIPMNIRTIAGLPIPETTYNGSASIASLTASIEVRCGAGFYGSNCMIECSNFVSCAGCGLPGFTGQFCQIDINECVGIDCNNGTCMDEINDFRCDCDTGFTGSLCETNINDCEGVDCNNGTCVDEVDNFRCDCDPGFTGDNCTININDCEGIDCNNGTCSDEINDFRCDCDTGFGGNRCDIDLDLCEGVDCNDGVCIDQVSDVICECDPGFTGDKCSVNIDDCEGVDCGNGICVDQVSSFICECIAGFTGEQCLVASAATADIVPIAGGVVGALVGVTSVPIIIVIVIVMAVRAKRSNKHTFTGLECVDCRTHVGPPLGPHHGLADAGDDEMVDNVCYIAWSSGQNNTLRGSNTYHEVIMAQKDEQMRKPAVANYQTPDPSLQEREFKNPIYGSEKVEREFKNPIYSADDGSAAQQWEQDNYYTIPNSPLGNVYDQVASDHPLDASTNESDSDGGVYSTVAT